MPSFPIHLLHFKHEAKKYVIFEGYANTFFLDRISDMVMPGAFEKTLRNWKSEKGFLPNIYLEHNLYDMVGICETLKEDKTGLFVQGRLLLDIPQARIAYESMKKGTDGLSIGFRLVKFHMRGKTRMIEEVELNEISIVKNPCNLDARIRSYKNLSHSRHLLAQDSLSLDDPTFRTRRALNKLLNIIEKPGEDDG